MWLLGRGRGAEEGFLGFKLGLGVILRGRSPRWDDDMAVLSMSGIPLNPAILVLFMESDFDRRSSLTS